MVARPALRASCGSVRGGQVSRIVSPETVICFAGSGRWRGLRPPSASAMRNLLPWQGQSMVPSATLATVQPWWVQMAEKALNSPAAAGSPRPSGRRRPCRRRPGCRRSWPAPRLPGVRWPSSCRWSVGGGRAARGRRLSPYRRSPHQRRRRLPRPSRGGSSRASGRLLMSSPRTCGRTTSADVSQMTVSAVKASPPTTAAASRAAAPRGARASWRLKAPKKKQPSRECRNARLVRLIAHRVEAVDGRRHGDAGTPARPDQRCSPGDQAGPGSRAGQRSPAPCGLWPRGGERRRPMDQLL